MTRLVPSVSVQAFNPSPTLQKELSGAPGLGSAECHDPLLPRRGDLPPASPPANF